MCNHWMYFLIDSLRNLLGVYLTKLGVVIKILFFQFGLIWQKYCLTRRQFTAPRFSDFFKYSWFKAGYVDYRPDQFLTPVQYCFDSYNVASDETKCGCGDFPFMKCAFCENFFCFTHSITTVHTCINNC